LSFEVGGPAAADATRTLVLDHPAAVHERRPGHEIAARARRDEPCIEQRHRLAGAGRIVLRFHGRLDAHPLPEITDIDPLPPTGARTRLVAAGDRLRVEAPVLPACAEVSVVGGSSKGWVVDDDTAELVVTWTAGLELVVTCRLGEPLGPRSAHAAPRGRLSAGRLHVPRAHGEALERLVERTRAYVLDCTAVRVGPGEICLLTDHRILPLSWTRDAYWQAALLLADGPDLDTVAAHLRWLWSRCERPDRFWMRSHHSNGARKDIAFQADQQLYPLLELADFRRVAGGFPDAPAGWWGRQVDELWDALPAGELGFVSSEENPADDETEHPFPLSAQLLYRLAATRLAELRDELGAERDFAATARRLATAIPRHFEVDGPFGRQWAYEIDGRGGHRLYHDANDLPTALAPLLGYCAADDPVWAATMRFAFSEHNPAWCGGLGSRHTPGAWTLGDVQEWVVASLLGERDAAERAITRLLAVATPDGLLPEAYDPATGGSPIRRWFAWPGAALATLLHGGPPR
jgi:hypothetical protein